MKPSKTSKTPRRQADPKISEAPNLATSAQVLRAHVLENHNTQSASHLTIRELWNALYSLVLSGHGDDTMRLYANGVLEKDSPLLVGVVRRDGASEVWISDTADVL